MSNKYQNANTSPEMLAEIKEEYSFLTRRKSKSGYEQTICDLLAMLELKDRQIDIYDTTLQQMKEHTAKLRAELHEQRWRKLSEEKPKLSEMILVHGKEKTLAVICFGVNDISEKWEYWHPISPPPKEV